MTAFLTERELAERLRCSVPALRVWRKQGLPVRRFGRLVRFDLQTVLDWFEQRQQQETIHRPHRQTNR